MNLRRYVREVRAINAVPVVTFPPARGYYRNGKPANADLGLYANAVSKFTQREASVIISLPALLHALLSKMARAQTGERVGNRRSIIDRTHIRDHAKKVFARGCELSHSPPGRART